MLTHRLDGNGVWHHVMNRAVGKRVLFENRSDVRNFLAHLARVVRRGLLEVHAYAILPTHFHLLARSPVGRLSDAMRTVEFAYVMRFNRVHERDGHLVQGRFRSRPVRSLRYLHLLVAYIDWNAVDARIVDDPTQYPYCSAWHYARPKGPRWLERSWIENAVCHIGGVERYSADSYRRTLGARPTRGRLRIVLPRLTSPPTEDDLDDILRAGPASLRAWFERRTRAADGMGLGPPLVDQASVDAAVGSASVRGWRVSPRGRPRSAEPILHAVLLRMLARLRGSVIARVLGTSNSRVADAFAAHRELVENDPLYVEVLARTAHDAIRRCHGETPASVWRQERSKAQTGESVAN